MPETFYTILTAIGRAKLANAIPLQQPLDMTTIKVGNSGGAYRNPADTDLDVVGEEWSGAISALYCDPDNPTYVVIEGVITAEIGPFYVREVGVFDQAGDMIAIGKYPETYKPELPAGAGKDLYIRFIMEVTNTAAVTLKINPAIVLATRQYADSLLGMAASSRVITQSGQVLANDVTLLVDASAGNIDLTFLSAAAATARGLRIKRVDETANRVRLIPQPGQTIEWLSYVDILRRGDAHHFQPNGVSNWLEMASAGGPAPHQTLAFWLNS
jgi:phage-related tail fiber protein